MGDSQASSSSLVTESRGTDTPTSGRPAEAERGTAIAPQRASPTEPAKPAVDPNSRLDQLIAGAVEEIDRFGSSALILLQIHSMAMKFRRLQEFGHALYSKDHPEFGNYLNAFLIVIHARISKRAAELVAADFAKFGMVLVPRDRLVSSDGSPGKTGVGLGSMVFYDGRTFVRLGDEAFYVSGSIPEQIWRNTSSVLFIYKQRSNVRGGEMYRLDWDRIKSGPAAGEMGWEHNIDPAKGPAKRALLKILNLTVTNHQPAGGWGKAVGYSIRVFRYVGKALFIAGLAESSISIYFALDKGRAAARAIGMVAGAAVGGAEGAEVGAMVGARGGPWGAAAGAAGGSLVGGWVGAAIGAAAADWAYCVLFTPLDAEEWVLLTEDQAEPAK